MRKFGYVTRDYVATVQLKGNLIHAGNTHAFFMRVARTRECVYGCTRTAHGYTRTAKDNCDSNRTASFHHPQFFMLVYLLSAY